MSRDRVELPVADVHQVHRAVTPAVSVYISPVDVVRWLVGHDSRVTQKAPVRAGNLNPDPEDASPVNACVLYDPDASVLGLEDDGFGDTVHAVRCIEKYLAHV